MKCFKMLLILLFLSTIFACSSEKDKQQTEPQVEADDVTNYVTKEGVIGRVDEEEKRILFIPGVQKIEIEGKSDAELGEMTKEKEGGGWFFVDSLDKYEKGQRISVKYDKSGVSLESDPPIRGAEEIKIIE